MDTDPLPATPAGHICGAISLALNEGLTMDAPQVVAVVIAVFALLLSGFVSGSEISYFSLTPLQREELEESPSGKSAMRLLDNPERLLATILIANNLVNVSIVVLLNFALGPVFAGMSALASFLLQTVLLTFLILLFGEILPKLYAGSNTLAWARRAAPGLTLFSRLFSPLSWMLVKSSGVVNRIVVKKQENLTADDLSQALELTDVQAATDKEMLEGILKFGDTTASEIMTPRVDMTDIDLSASFREVMDVVIESGYARIPVIDGSEDNIKGLLYARDLLPYIGRETDGDSTFDWRTLLRPAYFVPESRMIDDLLEDFRSRRIHMAVVIDEYGCTQGVVTLEDVLEEIVGDINDEYDEDDKTWRQLPDDTYVFEGRTLLTDFFRVTGLDDTDYEAVADNCETLAGMLLAIKGDFPKEKEPMVYGRCRFLVLGIEHHRITSVRVKVMPQNQTE